MIDANWLIQKDMAAACQVSVQAFTAWGVEPIHREGNRAYYAFADVLQNRLDHQRATLIDREARLVDPDGNVIDYHLERARLTKAQADNQELKRLKTEGALVEADRVSQFFSDVATAVKNRLRSLPTKIGPRVKGMNAAQATAEIREGVDEALTELGRRFIEI